MYRYLLLIFLFFSSIVLNAQKDEFFGEFKSIFDAEIQADIDKTLAEIKKAELGVEESEKLFASGNLSKALGIIGKSSDVFESDYRELFILFNEKVSEMQKASDGEINEYSAYLISQAGNYFRMSIAQRLTADKDKNDSTAFDGYLLSHQNEVKAIDVLSHTFAVITGRVVEEPDIPEIILPYSVSRYENSVTQNFIPKSFAVKNAQLPINYDQINILYPQDPNYTDNQTSNPENSGNGHKTIHNNKTNNNYNNSTNNNHSNSNIHGSESTMGHEFRIQIGISILPANDWQLKQINKTELQVKTYKSNIYYKYTVGSFADFQEAKNYKNAYGLNDTYIVEYNKGVEVKFYYGNIQK
jgi:hypothetical protein